MLVISHYSCLINSPDWYTWTECKQSVYFGVIGYVTALRKLGLRTPARYPTSQPARQTSMKGGDPDTPSTALFASSSTTALDNNRRVKCTSEPAIIKLNACDQKLKRHSRSSVNVRSCNHESWVFASINFFYMKIFYLKMLWMSLLIELLLSAMLQQQCSFHLHQYLFFFFFIYILYKFESEKLIKIELAWSSNKQEFMYIGEKNVIDDFLCLKSKIL